MSDFIEKMEKLNKSKDDIIRDIKGISTEGVTKNQAQNLREYAVQTDSIAEVLLYIEYQCARERKMEKAGKALAKLIKDKYERKGIEVIRYMLGMFARWVMIESKRGEKK